MTMVAVATRETIHDGMVETHRTCEHRRGVSIKLDMIVLKIYECGLTAT
ncbi:MAG: hypothetical protein AAFP84_10285 [Actinomycetota bacterium]